MSPSPTMPAGQAYEQIPRLDSDQLADLERRLCEAMGRGYEVSQMPVFFSGLHAAAHGRDWVDQVVSGRRAVERKFEVQMLERRVSDVWCGPLLLHMLGDAGRFHDAYNAALADYRRANGVRSPQRPIPDLMRHGRAVELPVWVYRADEGRRRLFVTAEADRLLLRADDEMIGDVPLADVARGECHAGILHGSTVGPWRLRPRALSLTLWARLLLGDLFVHGIGGAKYDRIADRIIHSYFGIPAPRMACVSATLRLDLPGPRATPTSITRLERIVRDIRYNPQRHVERSPSIEPLLNRREQAVIRSQAIRRGAKAPAEARRQAFLDIREASRLINEGAPGRLAEAQEAVASARQEWARLHPALDREFFFCLHSDAALTRLMGGLPAVEEFRV